MQISFLTRITANWPRTNVLDHKKDFFVHFVVKISKKMLFLHPK